MQRYAKICKDMQNKRSKLTEPYLMWRYGLGMRAWGFSACWQLPVIMMEFAVVWAPL